ncbi:MAG: peptidoglycan DD-metalloendopeptidase family protein [Muribaculaceae bacterium]|nr:peptidoglycan DD-metalloendopeptidase family protein [Muribaculaceae bacterium]
MRRWFMTQIHLLLPVLAVTMLVIVVHARPADTESEQESLQQLSRQIDAQRHRIVQLEAQLKSVSTERSELEREITRLSWEQERLRMHYAAVVRNAQLHRAPSQTMAFVLSARSWREMLKRTQFLQQLAHWRGEIEQRIVRAMTQRQKATARLRKIEQDCSANLKLCHASQQELTAQADRLSSRTLDRSLMDEKKQQVAALEERFRQASRQVAATATDEASTTDLQLPLTFPVAGHYRITDHYGRHRHPSLQYVTIQNNGIDIECDAAPVEAVAVTGGVVTAIYHQNRDRYVVMVRHGGYLSVYASLGAVTVKQGQQVQAGECLGSVSLDATTGKPLLHYELRHGHEKLNPAPFFKTG